MRSFGRSLRRATQLNVRCSRTHGEALLQGIDSRIFLESMAAPEKQEQLGPTEAFCLWFDDLYVLCHDPSIYNPGVYEKGLKEFESCFSNEELEAMARYHKYFGSIADDFNIDREWNEIQRDPLWQRLTNEAKDALNVFRRTKNT